MTHTRHHLRSAGNGSSRWRSFAAIALGLTLSWPLGSHSQSGNASGAFLPEGTAEQKEAPPPKAPPTRDGTAQRTGRSNSRALPTAQHPRNNAPEPTTGRGDGQANPTEGKTALPPDTEPARVQQGPPSQGQGDGDTSRDLVVGRQDSALTAIGSVLVLSNLLALAGLGILWRKASRQLDEHASRLLRLDDQLRRSLQPTAMNTSNDHQRLNSAISVLNTLTTRFAEFEKKPAAPFPSFTPPSNWRSQEPAPIARPATLGPIESVIEAFVRDQIDHVALLKAAEARGLRWGSGTQLTQQKTVIAVEFSNAENRILVIESVRGQSDFYLMIKDGAFWSLDLAFVFNRPSDEERVAGQQGRVRTRKPGRGTLQSAGEVVVTEQGLVELFTS